MPDPFPLKSLADLADGVTVVQFHPKHAQWVNNRVKLLDMVTNQHFAHLPNQPVTLAEMGPALIRIWNNIPQAFFNNLVRSMRRRCQAYMLNG
jgi:hypothetical protein